MMQHDFWLGAFLYPMLELAYRRRTHYSMALAGGLCLCALKKLRRLNAPHVSRAALGALSITAVELGVGLIFNRRHRVWDYRGERGNLLGQVCPRFCAAWFAMAWLITLRRR